MWLDKHPYFLVYLIGCVAAFFTIIFYFIFYQSFRWITRGNILGKNLAKISFEKDTKFSSRLIKNIILTIYSIPMSWLCVLIYLFRILSLLLTTIRETFTSVPEEVKKLRYPLLNNPDLSRESVWAYLYGVGVKYGSEAPSVTGILSNLNHIKDWYPEFNLYTALNILAGLNVVKDELIEEIRDEMRLEEEEEEFDNL